MVVLMNFGACKISNAKEIFFANELIHSVLQLMLLIKLFLLLLNGIYAYQCYDFMQINVN